MPYVNVSGARLDVTGGVVVPLVGDTIILSISAIPGSVRTKGKTGSVAGATASGYAIGRTATATVVGDWEVR